MTDLCSCFISGDLALMKKLASEKGFKSHVDHRESLLSTAPARTWCNYLQGKLDQVRMCVYVCVCVFVCLFVLYSFLSNY